MFSFSIYLHRLKIYNQERGNIKGSEICVLFLYRILQWGFDSRQGQEFFLFYKTFRRDVGPNPPQLKRYWGISPLGGVTGSVKLTNRLHSMKLGMSGAVAQLSNIPSWSVA